MLTTTGRPLVRGQAVALALNLETPISVEDIPIGPGPQRLWEPSDIDRFGTAAHDEL
jgi:hypothetical protein